MVAVGGRAAKLVAAFVVVTMLVGCGDDDAATDDVTIGGRADSGGPVAWPAPPAEEVEQLTAAAGLALEKRELLIHHVHSHLDVFVDGEHRTVPAGIGIVITDPGVRTFTDGGEPSYGGIEECDQPCISPLHTHDVTGVIHTESATRENNTLGQLFQQWDVRLDAECIGSYCTDDTPIRVFVDGEELPLADTDKLPLTDRLEVAIVIGRPPARIPDSADFSRA